MNTEYTVYYKAYEYGAMFSSLEYSDKVVVIIPDEISDNLESHIDYINLELSWVKRITAIYKG